MTEPVTPQPVSGQGMEDKASGRAIAAMVLGICSVVFGCCLFGIFGLGLGIAGLILSLNERKAIAAGQASEKGKVFALVGLITSIVGIVFGVGGLIGGIIGGLTWFTTMLGGAFTNMY
jgi:hypothetical protein